MLHPNMIEQGPAPFLCILESVPSGVRNVIYVKKLRIQSCWLMTETRSEKCVFK